METAYFVMHPTLRMTAVVFAPSTEKARTTFLDWLERNGHIRRADRQIFRKNMGTQRLDDPNVPADVVLHYGYEDRTISQEYRLDIPEVHDIPVGLDIPEVDEIPIGFEEPEIREEFTPIEPPGPKLMPIQQIMLRGFTK